VIIINKETIRVIITQVQQKKITRTNLLMFCSFFDAEYNSDLISIITQF